MGLLELFQRLVHVGLTMTRNQYWVLGRQGRARSHIRWLKGFQRLSEFLATLCRSACVARRYQSISDTHLEHISQN